MLLEELAMESNKSTMQVKLPPIAGQVQETLILNKNSIVLIGANGSGKTRMSVWIEENNSKIKVHRVSAQKSLDMPESTTPSDLKKTQNELLNGNGESENKSYYRWANKPVTHLLRDFDALMKLLITENYKKCLILQEQVKSRVSICYEPTKLDLTMALWEKIITNKRLRINETYIAVSDVNDKYTPFNGSEKGLLPATNLSNKFGWKKDYYIDYVINLLSGTDVSEKLCGVFRKYVNIEKNLEVSNDGTD